MPAHPPAQGRVSCVKHTPFATWMVSVWGSVAPGGLSCPAKVPAVRSLCSPHLCTWPSWSVHTSDPTWDLPSLVPWPPLLSVRTQRPTHVVAGGQHGSLLLPSAPPQCGQTSMDPWVVCPFWVLRRVLLRTGRCRFCLDTCSRPPCEVAGVELPGHLTARWVAALLRSPPTPAAVFTAAAP